MSRADRIFALLQVLQGGGTHTAASLAAASGVSERTIWRDMELLAGSGLPISGTRGLGYRLDGGVTLPPLVLTRAELEALRLGLDTVAGAADAELQQAARGLSAKLEAALPGHGTGAGPPGGLGRAPFARAAGGFAHMPLLRRAIREHLVLRLSHHAPDRDPAPRDVRPLRMDYLGGLWSLTAWCEARQDFRVFQVERIGDLALAGRSFDPEPGKRVEDYLARFLGGPDGN